MPTHQLLYSVAAPARVTEGAEARGILGAFSASGISGLELEAGLWTEDLLYLAEASALRPRVRGHVRAAPDLTRLVAEAPSGRMAFGVSVEHSTGSHAASLERLLNDIYDEATALGAEVLVEAKVTPEGLADPFTPEVLKACPRLRAMLDIEALYLADGLPADTLRRIDHLLSRVEAIRTYPLRREAALQRNVAINASASWDTYTASPHYQAWVEALRRWRLRTRAGRAFTFILDVTDATEADFEGSDAQPSRVTSLTTGRHHQISHHAWHDSSLHLDLRQCRTR